MGGRLPGLGLVLGLKRYAFSLDLQIWGLRGTLLLSPSPLAIGTQLTCSVLPDLCRAGVENPHFSFQLAVGLLPTLLLLKLSSLTDEIEGGAGHTSLHMLLRAIHVREIRRELRPQARRFSSSLPTDSAPPREILESGAALQFIVQIGLKCGGEGLANKCLVFF